MFCPICIQEISKGTTISCFGMCKRKFHLTCLALSVEDIKRILEKGMKWKCNVKYCFIGDGYNHFISYKKKELNCLVPRIGSEIENIENLFKSYSSTVQKLTTGLNDFQKEFEKLKYRYDRRSSLQDKNLSNEMILSTTVTLDELVNNGWVASKNQKLLKKSFEFENGSNAISFINRTSKVLEKESNESIPQITLQIKTVTIILASKEQEDTVDTMMLKTAKLIDGAAPSTTKKDQPQVKQEKDNLKKNSESEAQDMRKNDDNSKFEKDYEDKPKNEIKEDNKDGMQKNSNNKPQDERRIDNKLQLKEGDEDKSEVQDENESRPKVDQNNNSEPQGSENDYDYEEKDDDDEEEEEDDDEDDEESQKQCYFY